MKSYVVSPATQSTQGGVGSWPLTTANPAPGIGPASGADGDLAPAISVGPASADPLNLAAKSGEQGHSQAISNDPTTVEGYGAGPAVQGTSGQTKDFSKLR